MRGPKKRLTPFGKICEIRNETSERSGSIWRSESAPTSCGSRTVQGPRMQWA